MDKLENHFTKVLSSLKYREVEEVYDLYFSRYYGLHLANLAKYFGLTPTNLTMMSILTGVVGGGLLYFQHDIIVVVVAGLLITLAGLLDSADGQLARMTGQSSEFGRILDGLADSLVFIACYVGGTSFLVFGADGDLWFILLASVTGYMHNIKSGVYDFYKNEFLYYCGDRAESIARSPHEIKQKYQKQSTKLGRLLYLLYYDYTRRQVKFNSRPVETLTSFRRYFESRESKEKFQSLYYKGHLKNLSFWAWFTGLNTHRWGIIIACLFGRFDIYLWAGLAVSLGFFYTLYLEQKADEQILKTFE